MARLCPVDGNDLEETRIQIRGPDVVIDECRECGGKFLESAEVAKITGDKAITSVLNRYRGADADGKTPCPGCGKHMDAEEYHNVRIDVCMYCRGVWLDKGELGNLRTDDAPEVLEGEHKGLFKAAMAKLKGDE